MAREAGTLFTVGATACALTVTPGGAAGRTHTGGVINTIGAFVKKQ